jgi:hypothetical protein
MVAGIKRLPLLLQHKNIILMRQSTADCLHLTVCGTFQTADCPSMTVWQILSIPRYLIPEIHHAELVFQTSTWR